MSTAAVAVGVEREPWTDKPLTITDFVRYQGASGDMNPIHHDPAIAQKAGFDGPFAVGMLAAGVLGTYATDWLGPENLRAFKVRFVEQAWPGDVLTYAGSVTEVTAVEDGSAEVVVALTVTRQTGGQHLRGSATFHLPALS